MIEVGLRVVRSGDWNYDDQDGGEGHAGTVVQCTKRLNFVTVQWDNGNRSEYSVGHEGSYNLMIFDNATVGIKHTNILCDGCKKHDINGMRWKCSQCSNYNLCTLCYMSDIHDLNHLFQRFLTSNSTGVQLTAREQCIKIPLKGIFIGAKVTRGPDWDWGDQDGGQIGTVVDVKVWDSQSNPSVVTVTWPSGLTNIYRLGYKGIVDLRYIEPASNGVYYKEHLPLLGKSISEIRPKDNNFVSVPEASSPNPSHTFEVGDKVKVTKHIDTLKLVQAGHGEWNPRMAAYIGKIGFVHRITDKGDIRVQFEGCNNKWTFHPGVLKKIYRKDIYVIGDIVKVKSDVAFIKYHQKGHGEWSNTMVAALGKIGTVTKVYSDGDLRVEIGKNMWTFNPVNVVFVSTEANRARLQESMTIEMQRLLRDVVLRKAGISAVKEFLERYPGQIDILTDPGGGRRTCLQVAAHEGLRDLFLFLINAGASIFRVDDEGDTPLHYAAYGNQPEIIELLLVRGAMINAVNNQKCSALHVAASYNHSDCVKVLLHHACDVNLQDSDGNTALHLAININAEDIIEALCSCEYFNVELRNRQDFNVLHQAALKNSPIAVQKLLARARQLVDVKKGDGLAAIHLASLNGHKEVLAALLTNGQAQINLPTDHKQTPLFLAAAHGHWGCVELLITRNVDINYADEDGDTPLHVSILKKCNQPRRSPPPNSRKNAPRIYAIWKELARKQAKTQLALACFLVNIDSSRVMLETSRNIKGKSPLDLLQADPELAPFVDLVKSYRSEVLIDIVPRSEEVIRKSPRRSTDGGDHQVRSELNNGLLQVNPLDESGENIHFEESWVFNEMYRDFALKEILKTKVEQEKRKNDCCDNNKITKSKEEKNKDLERLKYLESRVADLEEANMCSICLEQKRNVAFLCGHGACEHCAAPLKMCHMCRQTITKKINLY